MISQKMKEQIYSSLPTKRFAVDIQAKKLHMQASRLASILKVLRCEEKVEWVGRPWVRGAGRRKSFWRRKK